MKDINTEEYLQVLIDRYAPAMVNLSEQELRPLLEQVMHLAKETTQISENVTIINFLSENDALDLDARTLLMERLWLKGELFSPEISDL